MKKELKSWILYDETERNPWLLTDDKTDENSVPCTITFEVPDQKIEITEERLAKAWDDTLPEAHPYAEFCPRFKQFKSALGFKD
jgi:hypothetical protein